MTDDLQRLVERIEGGERSNALDVLIELALFEPDSALTALRSNHAGTKVIGTRPDGREVTCWAADWTMHPPSALASLRARITQENSNG